MHRALNGVPGAEAPSAWIISRICEEFHCTPSVAIAELDQDYRRLIFEIMRMRVYAAAKSRFDNMSKGEKLDDVPMIEDVIRNEVEIVKGE
mgnify:FL=1